MTAHATKSVTRQGYKYLKGPQSFFFFFTNMNLNMSVAVKFVEPFNYSISTISTDLFFKRYWKGCHGLDTDNCHWNQLVVIHDGLHL